MILEILENFTHGQMKDFAEGEVGNSKSNAWELFVVVRSSLVQGLILVTSIGITDTSVVFMDDDNGGSFIADGAFNETLNIL